MIETIEDLPTRDGAAAGYGLPLASIPSQVAHIARDPLDPAFDERAFLRRLQGPSPWTEVL